VGRIEPQYCQNGTPRNGTLPGVAPIKPSKPKGAAGGWRDVAQYGYADATGNVIFQAVRQERVEG
jgi:hypothetical protein